jgi:hypothetical protein
LNANAERQEKRKEKMRKKGPHWAEKKDPQDSSPLSAPEFLFVPPNYLICKNVKLKIKNRKRKIKNKKNP